MSKGRKCLKCSLQKFKKNYSFRENPLFSVIQLFLVNFSLEMMYECFDCRISCTKKNTRRVTYKFIVFYSVVGDEPQFVLCYPFFIDTMDRAKCTFS